MCCGEGERGGVILTETLVCHLSLHQQFDNSTYNSSAPFVSIKQIQIGLFEQMPYKFKDIIINLVMNC